MRLVVKVIVDHATGRGTGRRRCLAENAAQRKPAWRESRTVGRSNSHCNVTP
jgi:hypothetical protein